MAGRHSTAVSHHEVVVQHVEQFGKLELCLEQAVLHPAGAAPYFTSLTKNRSLLRHRGLKIKTRDFFDMAS